MRVSAGLAALGAGPLRLRLRAGAAAPRRAGAQAPTLGAYLSRKVNHVRVSKRSLQVVSDNVSFLIAKGVRNSDSGMHGLSAEQISARNSELASALRRAGAQAPTFADLAMNRLRERERERVEVTTS